jgi:hypothetical protein
MMLAIPEREATVIDFTARIGDNMKTARAEYINRRREIWAARVPAAVKIIALAIIEHMNSESLECSASKARLAYMCNMPPKTFDRHYNAAKDLFHYHERKGKTTVFSPKMLSVAKELAILWPSSSDGSRANISRRIPSPKLTEGQNGTPSQIEGGLSGHTLPQIDLDPRGNGGRTPPQFDLPNSKKEEEEKEDISALQASYASDKPRPYSQPFEDFWKKYPRREGKGKAFSAWKRLSGPDRKKAFDQLGVQMPSLMQKAKDERGNFCPHAATWLGQRRFDDEPAAPAKTKPKTTDDAWFENLCREEGL